MRVAEALRSLFAAPRMGPALMEALTPRYIETRAGVTQRFGYYNDVTRQYDNNEDLAGPPWYGEPGVPGIVQNMLKDPYVRAAFNYRTNPLRTGLWEIVPGGEKPIDIEAAAYCHWAYTEAMDFDVSLRNVLLGMRDGVALIEQTESISSYPIDRFPLHEGRGYGMRPTGLWHVPAWTVRDWIPSDVNARQVQGVEQYITNRDGFRFDSRVLDMQKDLILRLTYEQEGANFNGFAMLRSAYQPWQTKLKYLIIEAMRHQRFGLGALWAKLGEEAEYGDDDEAELEAWLKDFYAADQNYIITPNTFEVQILGVKKDDGTDLGESIVRCNQDIFVNVGGQFATLGTGQFGSYALAATIAGQFGLGVETDAKWVEGGLTHGQDGWSPIRRTALINYPKAAPPKLRVRNLPVHDYLEGLKVLATLVEKQIIIPDDRVEDIARERLKISERLKDSPVRRVVEDSVDQEDSPDPFNRLRG